MDANLIDRLRSVRRIAFLDPQAVGERERREHVAEVVVALDLVLGRRYEFVARDHMLGLTADAERSERVEPDRRRLCKAGSSPSCDGLGVRDPADVGRQQILAERIRTREQRRTGQIFAIVLRFFRLFARQVRDCVARVIVPLLERDMRHELRREPWHGIEPAS